MKSYLVLFIFYTVLITTLYSNNAELFNQCNLSHDYFTDYVNCMNSNIIEKYQCPNKVDQTAAACSKIGSGMPSYNNKTNIISIFSRFNPREIELYVPYSINSFNLYKLIGKEKEAREMFAETMYLEFEKEGRRINTRLLLYLMIFLFSILLWWIKGKFLDKGSYLAITWFCIVVLYVILSLTHLLGFGVSIDSNYPSFGDTHPWLFIFSFSFTTLFFMLKLKTPDPQIIKEFLIILSTIMIGLVIFSIEYVNISRKILDLNVSEAVLGNLSKYIDIIGREITIYSHMFSGLLVFGSLVPLMTILWLNQSKFIERYIPVIFYASVNVFFIIMINILGSIIFSFIEIPVNIV